MVIPEAQVDYEIPRCPNRIKILWNDNNTLQITIYIKVFSVIMTINKAKFVNL